MKQDDDNDLVYLLLRAAREVPCARHQEQAGAAGLHRGWSRGYFSNGERATRGDLGDGGYLTNGASVRRHADADDCASR